MKRFVLAILLVVAGTQAQAATLTGMVLFEADSPGGFTIGHSLWNTTGGDGAENVYLQWGGNWLNTGNDAVASPNFTLGPGTTTIQFYADGAPLGNWDGINLFFDGQATPSITVLLNRDAVTFGPNSADPTPGLLYPGVLSNTAMSASFTTSGQTITLTSASVGFSEQDIVQAVDDSPGGSNNDVAGTLTLDLTTSGTVPEPGSLGLLLGGIGAIGLLIRRRQKPCERMPPAHTGCGNGVQRRIPTLIARPKGDS
jgi:hypothetical protein